MIEGQVQHHRIRKDPGGESSWLPTRRQFFQAIVAATSVCSSSRVVIAQYPEPGAASSWGAGKTAPPLSSRRKSAAAGLSTLGCLLSPVGEGRLPSSFPQVPVQSVSKVAGLMPFEAQVCANVFGVQPGFTLFEDQNSPNALASPQALLGWGEGTVLFGVRLLSEEVLGRRWWGAAVAGIMAHEWSHIVQFRVGPPLSQLERELQADWLAGWYLGVKAQAGTHVEISGLRESLFSKGYIDYTQPQTHGTPEQRVNAMNMGFDAARQGERSLIRAFQTSIGNVRDL